MKNGFKAIFPILLLLLLLMIACNRWDNYGDQITLKESTSINQILNSPDEFVGKTVLVRGKIIGVCKGSGCWVEIDDGSEKTLIAKSPDHSVAVPTDCEGRMVEVQGKVQLLPAHQEQEQEEHHQETKMMGEETHEEGMMKGMSEMHKSETSEETEVQELEEHTCPEPEIILTMEAVRLQQNQ